MTTRLPLLIDDQVGPPDLVAAIRQRRGGDLLALDRLLLHSPAFGTASIRSSKSRLALMASPLPKQKAGSASP